MFIISTGCCNRSSFSDRGDAIKGHVSVIGDKISKAVKYQCFVMKVASFAYKCRSQLLL